MAQLGPLSDEEVMLDMANMIGAIVNHHFGSRGIPWDEYSLSSVAAALNGHLTTSPSGSVAIDLNIRECYDVHGDHAGYATMDVVIDEPPF